MMGVLSGCACAVWLLCVGRRWSPYRLRSVLPSDLFRPGSFARHGLEVKRGAEYADVSEKRAVHDIGTQYGCHHCGRRIAVARQRLQQLLDRNAHRASNRLDASGGSAEFASADVIGFVADHIPPSKLNVRNGPQSFYPQCPRCSSKQSLAVKLNRRTLGTPHWKRLTISDFFIPTPVLALPLIPALHSITLLAQVTPLL